MFSERFFELALEFGDSWQVTDVKLNIETEEVDIFIKFIDKKGECSDLQ